MKPMNPSIWDRGTRGQPRPADHDPGDRPALGADGHTHHHFFVIGHIVGTVLLGIIIFQAKLAPPWAAAMLTASQPLHFIAIMTGLP